MPTTVVNLRLRRGARLGGQCQACGESFPCPPYQAAEHKIIERLATTHGHPEHLVNHL